MRTAGGVAGVRPGRGAAARPRRTALGVRPARQAAKRERRYGLASTNRRRLGLLLGIFVVAVVVGMAQVWVRLRIVRLGYALSAEANRTARLERLVRKLSVERALLRSPERIRKIAVEELGLRPPRPDEIVEIRAVGLFGTGPWASDQTRSRPREDRSAVEGVESAGPKAGRRAREARP